GARLPGSRRGGPDRRGPARRAPARRAPGGGLGGRRPGPADGDPGRLPRSAAPALDRRARPGDADAAVRRARRLGARLARARARRARARRRRGPRPRRAGRRRAALRSGARAPPAADARVRRRRRAVVRRGRPSGLGGLPRRGAEARAAVGAGTAGRRGAQLTRRAFPLVPRRRLIGTPFGVSRGARRGRGSDEFVVRELYVEESPRVMITVDRRPSMGVYGNGLPWLDKPAAVSAAADTISRAAGAARAELGHADASGGHARVLAPGSVAPRHVLDRVRRSTYDEPPGSLAATLAELASRRGDLPQGTFVFVLSDFLGDVPAARWTRLRSAGFDVVPVIVQDPTWEQSFPPVAGVLVPFASPGGEPALVRLTAREVREGRAANEARLDRTVTGFRRLGFDPLVLGTSAPAAVDA